MSLFLGWHFWEGKCLDTMEIDGDTLASGFKQE